MGSISIPLNFFIVYKFLEYMISESFFNQFASFHNFYCFIQIIGKSFYSGFFPSFDIHFKDIFFYRFREFIFIFYTFQSSCQHYAESKIGITGRIRTSELYSSGCSLSGFVHWYSNKSRPVSSCPGYIHRSFKSGYKPFIRVNPLIGYCYYFLAMF